MTPGARIAAAIEVLDAVAEGQAAEQALTNWARRSRFAGSKDRAAVRDHVFDVLRCRRSAAHLGAGTDGRALMLGLLRQRGVDPATLFTGEGHAPAALADGEAHPPAPPTDRGTRWNLPDWLVGRFEASLGAGAEPVALALQDRAPVTVRVNTARTSVPEAAARLLACGIETAPNPRAATALTLTQGARRLRQSAPYAEGLVDLQDAASQAVVADLPAAGRTLDYCAGGGGKALALATAPDRTVFAHDIAPGRMADLPARAARAGARITQLATEALPGAAPFDIVLCDAPCSGSGAWRRAPEGKWRLTPERLADLTVVQDGILDAAAALVGPDGTLAYATCSVLAEENEARIAAFLDRQDGWRQVEARRFPVDTHGDGFFVAHLTRGPAAA